MCVGGGEFRPFSGGRADLEGLLGGICIQGRKDSRPRFVGQHERFAGLARQRRGRSGIHAEVERRGDIRDAGEVDGLMAMGAGNIDEQLRGDGIRHRLIVRGHRPIQRDRRQTAGQRQATENPGQREPCNGCNAESHCHMALTENPNHYMAGL